MAENPDIIQTLPPRQEYSGPGKVSSALGGYWLWSIPGSIVATIASLRILPTFFETFSGSKSWSDAQSSSKVKEFLSKNAKNVGVAYAAGAVAFIMGIYGAIRGWGKAADAKADFDAVQNQRDIAAMQTAMLSQENHQLRQGVSQLQEAIVAQQKKFTDTIQSRHASAAGHVGGAHHDTASEHGHSTDHAKAEHHDAHTGHHAAKEFVPHASHAAAEAARAAHSTETLRA